MTDNNNNTANGNVLVVVAPQPSVPATGTANGTTKHGATVAAAPATNGAAAPAKIEGMGAARWVVLVLMALGALLTSVQSTALIIGFPVILDALDADFNTLLWVILGFQIACAVVVPLVGKLSDIFGKAALLKFGYACFTLSSLLSGLADKKYNGHDLIGYRCLMGFGAAFLFSNAQAIVTTAFAPYNQVGVAQGVFQLTFAAGSVLGPVVGGVLADVAWRWIFLLNVPAAGLCTIAAIALIKEPPAAMFQVPGAPVSNVQRTWLEEAALKLSVFDLWGAVLNLIWLTLLMFVLAEVAVPEGVAGTDVVQGPLGAVAGATFCIFVWHLWRVGEAHRAALKTDPAKAATMRQPLIPLDMFESRVYSITTVAGVCGMFSRGTIDFGMIFFLQGPFGSSPETAGIQLIPFGVGIILAGFISGKMSDVYGIRWLAVVGNVISAAGSLGLTYIKPSDNYWLIALVLFIIGCGCGIFNSPNAMGNLTSVPPARRGVASGLRIMLSLLASMVGIVMTFMFVIQSMPLNDIFALFIYSTPPPPAAMQGLIDNIHSIYYVSMALYLFAGFLSFFLPDRLPSQTGVVAPANAAAAAVAGGKKAGDVPAPVTAIDVASQTEAPNGTLANGKEGGNHSGNVSGAVELAEVANGTLNGEAPTNPLVEAGVSASNRVVIHLPTRNDVLPPPAASAPVEIEGAAAH